MYLCKVKVSRVSCVRRMSHSIMLTHPISCLVKWEENSSTSGPKYQALGALMFALIRSRSCSLLSPSCGKRFLWREVSRIILGKRGRGTGVNTAANHRRISSLVQVSGSPFGSGAAGNISDPQIAQTAVAVTSPPNATATLAPGFFLLVQLGRVVPSKAFCAPVSRQEGKGNWQEPAYL